MLKKNWSPDRKKNYSFLFTQYVNILLSAPLIPVHRLPSFYAHFLTSAPHSFDQTSIPYLVLFSSLNLDISLGPFHPDGMFICLLDSSTQVSSIHLRAPCLKALWSLKYNLSKSEFSDQSVPLATMWEFQAARLFWEALWLLCPVYGSACLNCHCPRASCPCLLPG